MMKKYFLFVLSLSILAILLGYDSNLASFVGEWGTAPDKVKGLMVSIAFLVGLAAYGIITGYKRKKGYVKFISVYWGIGCLTGITAVLMAPIGKLAALVIPIEVLTLVLAYGLNYWYALGVNSNNHYLLQIVTSAFLPWAAGAVGYLIGYLVRERLSLCLRCGKGRRCLWERSIIP